MAYSNFYLWVIIIKVIYKQHTYEKNKIDNPVSYLFLHIFEKQYDELKKKSNRIFFLFRWYQNVNLLKNEVSSLYYIADEILVNLLIALVKNAL